MKYKCIVEGRMIVEANSEDDAREKVAEANQTAWDWNIVEVEKES